jgi:preprotein translocase subunit SecD
MKLNFRLVLLIIATVFGIIFSLPSLTQSERGAKVTLGLDLQGGLHMVLGVKLDEAVTSQLKSVASGIGRYAESNDIVVDGLIANSHSVTFELLDEHEATKLDEYLKKV